MKEKKEKSIIRLSQSCVHSKIIARKKERQAGVYDRKDLPFLLDLEELSRVKNPCGRFHRSATNLVVVKER